MTIKHSPTPAPAFPRYSVAVVSRGVRTLQHVRSLLPAAGSARSPVLNICVFEVINTPAVADARKALASCPAPSDRQ